MKQQSDSVYTGLALSNVMALLIIFASIYPFTDAKLISQAMTRGLVSGFVIPLVILLFSGRWWVYRTKIYHNVISWGSFALIICGLVMILDLFKWTDWIGAPPIIQLGFYLSYGYYWPMIYFGGSVFILFCKVMMPDVENRIKTKKKVFAFSFAVFGSIWLQMYLYSLFGFTSIIIIQTLILGLNGIQHQILLIKPKLGSESQSNSMGSSDLEGLKQLEIEPKVIQSKGEKEPVIHIIMELGKVLFIMTCFAGFSFGNQWIVNEIIEKPTFLPLWLEFIPMLVIGMIFWLVCYHWHANRLVWTLLAIFIQITACIFLALDSYASDIYRLPILWCSAFALPGFIIGMYVHLNLVSKGLFRNLFLRIGVTTAFTFGFGYGVLFHPTRYDPNAWLVCIPVLSILGGIIIIGNIVMRLMKKADAQKKSVEQTLKSQKEVSLNQIKNLPTIRKMKATVIIGLMIGILFIVPSAELYIFQSRQQEHVLGTANQDYYLWTANSLRTIDKNYAPNLNGSTINNTVRVVMARGEHEGFQVIMSPVKVKNLNVWSFAPLADLQEISTGAKIGLGNITVSLLTYVPQLREQYPDRLYPFQRVDTAMNLFGQKNWPFYIDINIPRDINIQSGVYTTQMKMHCLDYHNTPPDVQHTYNNRDVTFNLEVEVLNFTIPLERHIGTEIIWGINDRSDWVDFYNDYRLDAYYPLSPVIAFNADPANLSITFNFTKWNNDLQYSFARGMRYFPVTWHPPGVNFSSGYTPVYETLLRYYIGNITAFLTGKVTPWNVPYLELAYFFVIDEPPPTYYDTITAIAKIVHSISPTMKIMETMNNDLSTYPEDFLEEVDIYCQYIHHWVPSVSYPTESSVKPIGWPTTLKSFVDAWIGPRPKTLWVYLTHNRFPTPDTDIHMSGVMQRNSFWLFWTYQISGWLYWSFNWGMDMDGGLGYAGFGESTLVGFGTDDQPLSSLRLERVRDGIEDFEYFWLLNATITKLESNGRSEDVVNAKALLHQVDQLFNQADYLSQSAGLDPSDDGYLWGYEPKIQPYLDLRLAVGREIARLNS